MQPLFTHQEETVQFLLENPFVFIASSPGVGKTRSVIEFIARLKATNQPHRALVFAPKSILTASWANDIRKFSSLTYAIADAANRDQINNRTADIVITNHDAVTKLDAKSVEKNTFTVLVIDESTAFKAISTQRSKSMAKIAALFHRRILMSGTPNPNGIMDLWHQYKILDGGDLLGSSYYRFRNLVCEPKAGGQFTKWADKPGSAEAVADMVSPITIRHNFADVLDIPENFSYVMPIELSKQLRFQYDRFVRHTMLEADNQLITAQNAGAKLNKLLQIASGAAYTDDGAVQLDNSRAMLIRDLIEARDQCLVAYQWNHQLEAISKALSDVGISFGVINGDATPNQRSEAVAEFQAGRLQVILAHPAAASHGLTLTAGTTTIWASPTWNAEHFTQFNHRIFRAGQTQRTETIQIIAANTADEQVAERMTSKLTAVEILLAILNSEQAK